MAGPWNASEAVYLDHAATTPLRPEVEAVIAAASREAFANPSSQHAAGRRARQILEESRERIVDALGGRGSGPARDRLVFTSGATEANRFALFGAAHGPPGAVATSARDHASLRSSAVALAEQRGWSHTDLPLSADGSLDPAGLAAWLDHTASRPARLLGTTLVCGQTGSSERWGDPQAPLARLVRAASCFVHSDATQAVAVEPVVFSDLGIASMTLAPHKFGGPRGIGGLLIRGDIALAPIQPGPQETGLRGGTEPVALAAGFAEALDRAVAERASLARRLETLRDHFEASVVSVARSKGIAATVLGGGGDRSPHVSTIAFPNRDRQALVMAADLAGLCCSTGTACASGSSEPSPALVAMGLPADVVRSAVRFSFGRSTTRDDLDRAVAILAQILSVAMP
ncbi:MAG: cysteine desulfurase family protein [Planctomycetia bacterium]